MKRRSTNTSALYTMPDPGELDQRVRIRQRVDMPSDDMGTEPIYPVGFDAWAKIVQTSATTYRETAQTDEAITHYITIRFKRGITSDFEVVLGEQVYRVQRARDLNSKRRFLLLECTELGIPAVERGIINGDTLFSR